MSVGRNMSQALIGVTIFLLLLGTAAPSLGEHPAKSLMRLSNVGSQPGDFKQEATAEQQDPRQIEALLPEWLDDILASTHESMPAPPATAQVQPAPPAQPSSPLQPPAPVGPVASVQPAAPVGPTASVQPTAPAEPATSVQSSVSEQPSGPTPVASVQPSAPVGPTASMRPPVSAEPATLVQPAAPVGPATSVEPSIPEQPAAQVQPSPVEAETAQATEGDDPAFLRPQKIPALYTSPPLEGEGVWSPEGMPEDAQGKPLMYRTAYRPSVEYPNSIVYMALFDMKRIKPRFFVGQTEPGVYGLSDSGVREDNSKIVAVTNAMWMQRHAKGAGAIFRGREIYPMVPGMATLVVYSDDSVDIIEWTDEIPRHLVKDARQLRHLIVKDGRVVEQVLKGGKIQDSELGLGGFLVDNNGVSTMRNKFWFLANRTAFGIREDGNLVFAMAHHCSTKDMAKALVLAGCKRAIHADANIHNIVCNFYFRSDNGKIVKRDKLSPEQLNYTMKRYDNGYAKDFFAFYER